MDGFWVVLVGAVPGIVGSLTSEERRKRNVGGGVLLRRLRVRHRVLDRDGATCFETGLERFLIPLGIGERAWDPGLTQETLATRF